MLRSEVNEALAIIDRMMDQLAACFLGATGRSSFAARNAIGGMRARAESYLRNAALGAPLQACFDTTRVAGATFNQFTVVHRAILAETPIALPAVLVVQAGIQFVLSQMARVLAATTFVSRTDADDALVKMNDVFDPAEEAAADQHDAGSYQALLTLHGAVTRDLTARGLLLPRVIDVTLPEVMPSLWIANHLYYDGSRADEIAAENKVVHPAFCPLRLRILSQ